MKKLLLVDYDKLSNLLFDLDYDAHKIKNVHITYCLSYIDVLSSGDKFVAIKANELLKSDITKIIHLININMVPKKYIEEYDNIQSDYDILSIENKNNETYFVKVYISSKHYIKLPTEGLYKE